jgi:hypothetical protein
MAITQTIIERVQKEDGKFYRIEHTMVTTEIDDKAEKLAAIVQKQAELQKQIDDLENEKASAGAPKL